MFSYFTPYKAASGDTVYPVLRGAALDEGNKWIFYSSEDEYPEARVFDFASMNRRKDGSVLAYTRDEVKWVFTPITVDEVKNKPSAFGLDPEEAEFLKRPSDLYLVLVAAAVPEWYEERYAPEEELESVTSEPDPLIEAAFFELRGVEAEVGALHKWKDGWYRKQPDHSWRKEPTAYPRDTHPDIPESTAKHYWDAAKKTWTPERKKLHKQLLDEARAEFFKNLKPVPPGKSPVFTYMMGPPAAGKSTPRSSNEFDNAARLDPDYFVVRTPEFQKAKELGVRSGAVSVAGECMQLNDVLVDEAMENRFNFVIEGSGRDTDWMLKDFFPRLKAKGYSINIVAAYVEDLDELLLRAEDRGERSGRFVPPDRIEKIHEVTPGNLKKIFDSDVVDTAVLMDTHFDRPRRDDPESGAKPWFKQAFMQVRKAGEITHRQVLDTEFFDRVMAAADKAAAEEVLK